MAKKNRTTEVLCEEWLAAKKEEKDACARRIALEEELIALVGFDVPEGQKTYNPEGFKAVLKAALNRKFDWDAYDKIESNIPEELRPVKIKREVDVAGVKYLQETHPKLYTILSKVMEVKPAKVSVDICRKE